jgi:hypothetical protein
MARTLGAKNRSSRELRAEARRLIEKADHMDKTTALKKELEQAKSKRKGGSRWMDGGFDRTGDIPPEEEPGPGDDPLPSDNTDLHGQPPNSGPPWRRIAVLAGGAVVTAAGSVVATLAATHRTAVFENAKAYAHGWHDALEAVRDGLDPFDV